MKKRILSMFLVLVMIVLTISEITVVAADAVIYVGGVELKSGQYVTNNAVTAVTGVPDANSEGYAYFKDGVLLMNHYNYSGEGDAYNRATVYSTDSFEISLVGDNTLNNTSSYGYGLCGGAYADITIGGTGSLDITGIGYDGISTGGTVYINSDVSITANGCGIYADQVDIGGGTVGITANDADAGIYTIYDTEISGGNVTIYSKYGDGIASEYGDVFMEDAIVNMEAGYRGIHADGSVAIADCSKVTIKANDDSGIYAMDTVEITNCSDVDIQSTYEYGIYARDVITISKSNVSIISDEHGIYTAKKDDAEIIIQEQSTVTIDSGEDGIRTDKEDCSVTISASTVNITNSDYGIYTKDDDSSVIIENDSNVTISSLYYGVYTKDSSISVTGGVVHVTAQDEYGLAAKGSVTIDGNQTRVNITSTAADANGIDYGGALYMDGGWLNNNGNHTVASDVTLKDALTIEVDRMLTILPNVVLTMQAKLTNNGIIANDGTLVIPTSADLTGSGNINAGGIFQIANYLDGEMHVPEDLVYTGADLTDDAKAKISLFESVVLQHTTFTYLHRNEWSLSITPNTVKDADDYNAVFTKGNYIVQKKFTVAKANGPKAPIVLGSHTNDGMTYTYTVNAIDGAQYSKDCLTWQDGNVFSGLAPGQQYIFYARVKETDNYKVGDIGNSGMVLLEKLPGEGTVSMEGWIYGETAKNPVAISDTNGISNVTYLYKSKDADDSTYGSSIPTKVGDYTVKACFGATATHEAATATADFTIVNINVSIDGITEENVKSTDKEAIQEVIDQADTLLSNENLPDDEKQMLEEIKQSAEKLIEVIEEITNAIETENIKNVEGITSDNVTLEDKTDLENAKGDIEKALNENRNHYTEDEKTAIENEIKRIDDALAVISNVESVEDKINQLPDTITKADEAAIKAAQKAYNALTDYEKSLVRKDVKKKLDDAKAALIELNRPVDDDSCATGDNSNMVLWIALLFISVSAIITLIVADRKRRYI